MLHRWLIVFQASKNSSQNCIIDFHVALSESLSTIEVAKTLKIGSSRSLDVSRVNMEVIHSSSDRFGLIWRNLDTGWFIKAHRSILTAVRLDCKISASFWIILSVLCSQKLYFDLNVSMNGRSGWVSITLSIDAVNDILLLKNEMVDGARNLSELFENKLMLCFHSWIAHLVYIGNLTGYYPRNKRQGYQPLFDVLEFSVTAVQLCAVCWMNMEI